MKSVLEIPRTAMEVFSMLPEGTLCEVIDNAIYMSPAPTPNHQKISLRITLQISLFLTGNPLGEIYTAPCDVYFNEVEAVVEPDIFFIKSENLSIIKEKGIYGAPDFIIEILSSNVTHDKKRKLKLYEENQVPEYIIVDPESKEVSQYLMADGIYQLQVNEQTGQFYINQLSLLVTF